jgi:GDP-mannose 6-dehydrogenase
MNVVVIGLGYVGSVTSACFAAAGNQVVGVDVSAHKVDQLNNAISPVHEPDLERLIQKGISSEALKATTRLEDAWDAGDVFIVSVGTPTGPSGDVRLDFVTSVARELGALMKSENDFKVFVITSTVPPGTLRNVVQPLIEEFSGKRAGMDFGLAFSPEFLREGTAVEDFSKPERVVIGADDPKSIDRLRRLFGAFAADPVITSPEVAESVKFAANAWHALKVAFANEIGRTCAANGVDSHDVMEIFKSDKKLNISEKYLTPGFSFGGSCLPKDVRTLTYRARSQGVRVPVLEALLPSNEEHLAFALREIEALAPRRITVMGLAFKADTDDLRESPAVPLVEALIGRGYQVRIYDEQIQLDKLVGANREYVLTRLPHLVDLLVTNASEAVLDADLVVIAQANSRFNDTVQSLTKGQAVLDLAGVARGVATEAEYRGLSW